MTIRLADHWAKSGGSVIGIAVWRCVDIQKLRLPQSSCAARIALQSNTLAKVNRRDRPAAVTFIPLTRGDGPHCRLIRFWDFDPHSSTRDLRTSLLLLLIITTDADSSHVYEYSDHPHLWLCLSVCLSVCPHDKTKTVEIAKLGTGIVHHDTSPTINIRAKLKSSKVKVTGSKCAKGRDETAVRRRRPVALWRPSTQPAWRMHSIECPASGNLPHYYRPTIAWGR